MSIIKIECLDHVVLNVWNIEKMLPFYCDLLGFRLVQRSEDGRFVQLRAGTATIDMLRSQEDPSVDPKLSSGAVKFNMNHFALRLESFEEEVLREQLGRFEISAGKLWKNSGEGGPYSFYIKDPEGNEVELTGMPN